MFASKCTLLILTVSADLCTASATAVPVLWELKNTHTLSVTHTACSVEPAVELVQEPYKGAGVSEEVLVIMVAVLSCHTRVPNCKEPAPVSHEV